jgi:hypothetical protein
VKRASLTRRARSWTAAFAATVALCAATARAQERGLEASYFAGKLSVGAGGDVEIEGETATLNDDLLPSWGAAAQYMARVHRHFAIGGVLALWSWQSADGADADRDRKFTGDGAVVPAGVLPLGRDAELYLAAGLALSVNVLGDRAEALEVSGVDPQSPLIKELDEGIGFALLPALGGRLALTPSVGLLAEVGYALRWYEHELVMWDEEIAFEIGRRIPIDVALGQLTFALGVFFD